jgi:hypothetical protein
VEKHRIVESWVSSGFSHPPSHMRQSLYPLRRGAGHQKRQGWDAPVTGLRRRWWLLDAQATGSWITLNTSHPHHHQRAHPPLPNPHVLNCRTWTMPLPTVCDLANKYSPLVCPSLSYVSYFFIIISLPCIYNELTC